MARPRQAKPRLSWFRFFSDDFLGGTQDFTTEQIGAYLLLLTCQWASKNRKIIPSDETVIRRIIRWDPGTLSGTDSDTKNTLKWKEFWPKIRLKFDEIRLFDGVFLRNKRMAEEWDAAQSDYYGRVKGAESTNAERGGKRGGKRGAERGGIRVHPEPEPEPEPEQAKDSLFGSGSSSGAGFMPRAPAEKQNGKPPDSALVAALLKAAALELDHCTEGDRADLARAVEFLRDRFPKQPDSQLVTWIGNFGDWFFNVEWPGKVPRLAWIPRDWPKFAKWKISQEGEI